MNQLPAPEPRVRHSRHLGRRLSPAGLLGIVVSITTLVLIAGCGSSGNGGLTTPAVAPAKTFSLVGFQPAGPVVAGKPTRIAFTIQQPSGQTLTAYRQCCDPHKGVDLIIVRSDDSHVQYDDSDISPGGQVTQPVVFPTPGRYRIVVDAYPAHTSPNSPINFQLFTWVTVHGAYHKQPLAPPQSSVTTDGYTFQILPHPQIKAIQPTFLNINVSRPDGSKAVFSTWRGAKAHSIFIHQGSLDYFHTHVCSPGAIYCTSVLGAARVTGSSSQPGRLRVGVLLPEPGTWRLFLLTYIDGHYLTAPFTLKASS